MLDHQVRYATSINTPGQGPSGDWYVEFEATDLPDAAAPMCYQWRLDPVTNVLSTRNWSEDGAVNSWRSVSWDVKAPGGGSPFTFAPASGQILRQTLTVHLKVDGRTAGQVAEQQTTFVARNSSLDPLVTRTNDFVDVNGDGVNDNAVCMTGMDRP